MGFEFRVAQSLETETRNRKLKTVSNMGLFSRWKDRYIKEPIAEQAAVFIDKGQYNLAIRTLEEGLDIDPDYPSFIWLRAEAAFKTEDWESALACYEDLEEILGRDTPATLFEARAKVFFLKQSYENAISAYVQAEKKGIDDIHLFFNRGVSFLHIGGYDMALKDFLKVEKRDPDFPALGLFLAETYFFLEKYRTATAYFRRAAQQRDLTEKQFAMLAEAYLKMNAYKKASIILSTLIHKFSDRPHYLNKRATCYLNMGELDEALNDLNRVIKKDKNFSQAFSNRGRALLLKDQLEAGKKDLEKAIALDASNGRAYRDLSHYFLLKDQPETALRQLEKAFIIDEKIPLLYYFKGLALLKMGEEKEGRRALLIAARQGEEQAMEKLNSLEEGI